jgi:hypothetical protein
MHPITEECTIKHYRIYVLDRYGCMFITRQEQLKPDLFTYRKCYMCYVITVTHIPKHVCPELNFAVFFLEEAL